MAFSFGAPPGPAAAPSGNGNTGNSSTPAPAAPAASTGGGFSFGGATNGPATTPASTAPPAAPSTSAPATSGFSFGASACAAPSTTTAPATSGFSFGGNATTSNAPSAPSPAAPAPAFTFSHAPSAATPAAPTPAATVTSVVTVPEYTSIFPNMNIIDKLDSLLPQVQGDSNDARLAAQELQYVLDCTPGQDVTKVFGAYLAKPTPCQWKQPDAALREKLRQNPHVTLQGRGTAPLTPPMLDEVFMLSNELRISEVDALALYAQASLVQTRNRLQDRLEYSFCENAMTGSTKPIVLGDDVFQASRELYFYERSCAIKAILKLIQCRLELNTFVLAATDQLLVANLIDNLISYIREWTKQTDALEQELSQASRPAQNMFGLQPPPADTKNEKNFAKVHLKFGHDQRQTAAESLFYLTYHSQCTPEEVGSLIDLVKDLTNGITSETTGLPLLDPFKDVPNAFHQAPLMPNNQFPFTQPLPALHEKDAVKWQHELVDQVWNAGGKPQLLQCVSTLVLSGICALDSRHELVDRSTHTMNSFGVGNALFPPQGTDTQQLLPVHSRLDPLGTAGASWKRKDIWGLLVASYALLLRSLPSVANSPRVSGSIPTSPRPQGPVDVKTTWRACMNAPTGAKAFTCARLCLMPSFECHKDKLDAPCDTYEFFMSVLSDFMSHFLDILCASGNVPISRFQWERDAERELALRREQQVQQHQFRAWSGTSASTADEEVIPTSVDLMARPDCLDDVIALAIALCSAGSSYARSFWSTSEIAETSRKVLVPSRALRKLKHQLEGDKSLLPVYVSFLAALALAPAPSDGAESGATLVNTLLSPSERSDSNRVDWLSLLEAIRWYARELSAGSQSVSKSSTESSSPGVAGRASTAYYYGAEDNGAEGSVGYSSSQQATSSTSSSTSSKPREMGETNTNILLSHLAVISTVASESAAARSALVSMKLPVASQDPSSFAEDDPILTVLFLLSIAPLTPLVRGAVFSTIASLLKVDGASSDELKVIREQASKGWELLDTCRVLPISLLDQYESLPQGAAQIAQGLAFPPSSISLVSKETKGAWLPPERIYGIIFELEQIEYRTGQYPSTEGFLQLLTSLFIAAGSPEDLGKESRTRPGCTPYIEYVANFVLARALGTNQESEPLPFRSPSDKGRLVSRGLEVIEAVLVRYTVPPPPPVASPVPPLVDEKKNKQLATNEASQMFGLPSLVEKVVVPPNENDAREISRDYRDTAVLRAVPRSQDPNDISQTTSSMETVNAQQAFSGGEPPVPRAKSPGFTVLAEMLSTSAGPLLHSVVRVLTDDGAARGIRNICGLDGYKELVTQALFGQTPPTLLSARAKSTDTSHISAQALLQPLLPQLEVLAVERSDAVCWRETSIILALHVLCAAAAREGAFYKAVSSGQMPLKIVPVLRFHRRTLPPSGVVLQNVQVSRLADLLISLCRNVRPGTGYVECFPVIIQYIQCDASDKQRDAYISSPAVALSFYASRTLGNSESIRALVGSQTNGLSQLARCMGSRLSRSATYASLREDNDVASLILDSILSTFRGGRTRETSFAHVVLGLPFVLNGNWVNGTYENAYQLAGRGGVVRDCFDAILERIADLDFLIDSSSSSLAARCFEIIFRLTEEPADSPTAARRVGYAANVLRSTHFWTTNLMCLLADHSSGSDSLLSQVASIAGDCRPKGIDSFVQCIAWLLKSVSGELLAVDQSLSGSDSGQRRQLLSLLFSSPYRLLMNVLNSMPISNDRIAYLGNEGMPSREALEKSRVPMSGAPEVVGGYTLVNKTKLSQQVGSSSPSLEGQLSWADRWNAWASWDCAASHLSVAVLYLIESAIASSSQPSLVLSPGAARSAVGAFELQTPVAMLKMVLSRVVDEGSEVNGRLKMDDRLSPKVSDSLSRIVLLLSEQMASTKASTGVPNISMESAVVEICRMLVQTVIWSSFVDRGRTLLPHEKLRTATFGLALAVMMKSDPNTDLLDGLVDQFLQASIELGRIACSGPGISLSEPTEGVESLRARSLAQLAFSSILDLYRDEETLSIVPVMAAPSEPGMARTIVQSVVSLIASLDDQIFLVVEKIIACREGPELLFEARLPRALLQAARDYVGQEQRAKEDVRFSSVSFNTPSFLKGHMALIKFLFLSMLSASNRGQLTMDIVGVLLTYTDVVHRMFGSFPREADVLVNCLQCLLLTIDDGGLQQFVSDERSAVWNQDVLQLSYMLSQNPFPSRYLPTLPMKLKDAGRNVSMTGSVSVNDAYKGDSSWWDAIEQLPQSDSGAEGLVLAGPPSGRAQDYGWRNDPSIDGAGGDWWTPSKYETALLGAKALATCVSYLESLSTVQSLLSLDGCALARGLCRCSDVAKGSHFRVESLQRDLSESERSGSTDAMEVTWDEPIKRRKALKLELLYTRKLGEEMQHCSEMLLMILLAYFRALIRANENSENYPSQNEGFRLALKVFSDAISAALDYTKLDSLRFGSGTDNEQMVLEISKLLREETKKVP